MKLLIACAPGGDVEPMFVDLQCAGLPDDTEATVLSVADVLLVPADESTLAPAVRQLRARAEGELIRARHAAQEFCDRLRGIFPQWELTAEAQADAPAWAIVSQAERMQATLTIVGAHDRSLLSRLVFGSVSHAVLTHTAASVRIARAARAYAASPRRLLIGIDGSPGAAAAVAAVAARKWPQSSCARLVVAADAALVTSLDLTSADRDELSAVRRIVERASAPLAAAGLDVSSAIVQDDPKQVLVREASTWNADCVFVGARGLRALPRILLGSVSTAVAARAPCSVEVVR